MDKCIDGKVLSQAVSRLTEKILAAMADYM